MSVFYQKNNRLAIVISLALKNKKADPVGR